MSFPSIEDYRAQYTPLPQVDIDKVEAGANDRLVEAATEQRDPASQVADMQNERDWLAAAGDFDAAEAMDNQYMRWASPQLDFEAEAEAS